MQKYLWADFRNSENQIILNEHVSQWDIGMTIDITLKGNELPFNGKVVTSGIMLHFANKFSEKALVVAPNGDWVGTDPTDRDNYICTNTFNIPNSLLEQATPIFAYVTIDPYINYHYTMKTAVIIVDPRKQPNDYISKQDYIYTLEALRTEMKAIINAYENEREADYQDFKNQIKQDIQNLVIEQTKFDIKSYQYLTDNSVKCNDITYTITKDESTGLINKITNNSGTVFLPTIKNTEITDVALHNAVFWATVISNGFVEHTFNMSGIIGMFTPKSRDVANNLWKNEVSGYNNIVLTGGSKNGDAIHFEVGEYGSFTCAEPKTVYAIVKTKADSSKVNGIITKKLSQLDTTEHYGFNLLQGGGHLFFSTATYDVEQMDVDCTEYHTYCFTRNTSGIAYYYIDGVLFGTVSGCKTGLYGNMMYLNNEWFGSTQIDPPTVCDFLMCAFGTTYHDEVTVQKNMAYLSKAYI